MAKILTRCKTSWWYPTFWQLHEKNGPLWPPTLFMPVNLCNSSNITLLHTKIKNETHFYLCLLIKFLYHAKAKFAMIFILYIKLIRSLISLEHSHLEPCSTPITWPIITLTLNKNRPFKCNINVCHYLPLNCHTKLSTCLHIPTINWLRVQVQVPCT